MSCGMEQTEVPVHKCPAKTCPEKLVKAHCKIPTI